MTDWLTFEGTVQQATTRAVVVHGVYWEDGIMFPRSQVEVMEDDGSEFKIIRVAEWLARKRGLLEFTHYTKEQVAEINSL